MVGGREGRGKREDEGAVREAVMTMCASTREAPLVPHQGLRHHADGG